MVLNRKYSLKIMLINNNTFLYNFLKIRVLNLSWGLSKEGYDKISPNQSELHSLIAYYSLEFRYLWLISDVLPRF